MSRRGSPSSRRNESRRTPPSSSPPSPVSVSPGPSTPPAASARPRQSSPPRRPELRPHSHPDESPKSSPGSSPTAAASSSQRRRASPKSFVSPLNLLVEAQRFLRDDAAVAEAAASASGYVWPPELDRIGSPKNHCQTCSFQVVLALINGVILFIAMSWILYYVSTTTPHGMIHGVTFRNHARLAKGMQNCMAPCKFSTRHESDAFGREIHFVQYTTPDCRRRKKIRLQIAVRLAVNFTEPLSQGNESLCMLRLAGFRSAVHNSSKRAVFDMIFESKELNITGFGIYDLDFYDPSAHQVPPKAALAPALQESYENVTGVKVVMYVDSVMLKAHGESSDRHHDPDAESDVEAFVRTTLTAEGRSKILVEKRFRLLVPPTRGSFGFSVEGIGIDNVETMYQCRLGN